MAMDGQDHGFLRDLIEDEGKALRATIREEATETNALLLQILNELRRQRHQSPVSVARVMELAEEDNSTASR